LGKIRVIDQVKADRPGHVVPAEEVRAMVGVLVLEGNVSKKFVTTTSSFAPGIARDPDIARLMC
jgi:restriction system protein